MHGFSACLGVGQHAWRVTLAQRKAFMVHQLIPWGFLMQGWQHGARQHDVCEFFSHLICRMQASPFLETWNARFLEAGQTCIHDCGDCSNMLTLDAPADGPWNLQDLIYAWKGQAFIHALGWAPQRLAIGLSRFQQLNASGSIRKVRTALR